MGLRWRRLLNLGLWLRMALAISFGFLVLLVAFAVLGEWALRDSAERIREERLVIAQMAASQIDGLLQEAISELEQAPRFANFDPADPRHLIETDLLAHTYGQVGLFRAGIIFLNPSGQVVLAYPSGLYPAKAGLASLPHIAQALETKAVTISEPFRDPLNQRPVVAVTVPIYKQQTLVGFLSGLVDLSQSTITTPLKQAATLGNTGHAALVDSQGQNLASTLGLPFRSLGEHFTFYRRAMAEGRPVVETVPFELDLPSEPKDDIHVMAFVPLQKVPWGVAVGGDLDETYAGVQRLRLGLALLSIVAVATVWAATLLGTRKEVQAVQHLTEKAQRIAKGDLSTPLQATTGGEIGAMTLALEQMRLQLLSNIDELANWNKTLEARVAQQTEELRQQQTLTQQLLRRAITAQEQERAYLAREMHDGIGQMLTAVELSLDRLAKSLPADDKNAQERLGRAQALTGQTLVDLRRIIAALRPGVLDQLGLVPALSWLSEHTLRPLDITATLEAQGLPGRLPGEIETILFRIAQEAINNVARHSHAKHLAVRVEYKDSQVTMTLSDDGQGCDLSALPPASDYSRRLGLASMQERASLTCGEVTIKSAPGQGTTVQVIVPVAELAGEI